VIKEEWDAKEGTGKSIKKAVWQKAPLRLK